MVLWILQNAARPIFFAAPRRLARLLERLFSYRALHINGLFTARPI
jgi:hypothetical protein